MTTKKLNMDNLERIVRFLLSDYPDQLDVEGVVGDVILDPLGFLQTLFEIVLPKLKKDRKRENYWVLGFLTGVAFSILSNEKSIFDWLEKNKISNSSLGNGNEEFH